MIDSSSVRYSEEAPRSIFTLTLMEKATQKSYRFIQSHLPGGPNALAGSARFAEVVLDQFDPSITSILLGDMNQSPQAIQQTLKETSIYLNRELPYQYIESPYPTHINTHQQASWIDLFFIYFSEPQETVQPSDEKELLEQLVNISVLIKREGQMRPSRITRFNGMIWLKA